MSNLLEQASLVMIPSGYKEDVVYSQIPLDGSGDLQMTRASNGTRVNSAGLVEVCPWNLLTYSEDFTNADWNKSNVTVTSNDTTAPNGTTTADKIAQTSGGYVNGNAFGTGGNTYVFSVYLKAGSVSSIRLRESYYYGTSSTFNLSSGTASATGIIESVGNGWFRCSLPQTYLVGEVNLAFIIDITTVGNYYAWGAQLNIGSTAKPYFPTTDRLNVPRLTYQNGGGGCPSLLLEKQSTNLFTYSEEFDNAAWNTEQASVTANTTTSPDGTQNADSLTENTATNHHLIYQGGTVSAGAYTQSVFIKKNTRQYAFLQIATDTAANRYTIVVDLDNGSVTATSTAGSPTGTSNKIDSMGNGWYRLTVTATHTSGVVYMVFGLSNSANPSFSVVATPTYTGNGTGSIYIYGAQIEASSYPTSYISTTSASATRVADACFKTGISSLIGQTSGSVFFDFTVDSVTQPTDPVLWYMKDGGGGERYVELYSNGNLVYAEIDGGGPIAVITKSALTVGRHKCAIAYATNDFVFYVDGVQIGTDTNGTPNGFSTFGLQYYLSAYTGQQKVNQAAIFKTRLTNAELASLTTI
jgi:hypothetical protein